MHFDLHKRSASMGTLARQTLKELKTRKSSLNRETTISMLKQLRTSYERPFASVRPNFNNQEEAQEQSPIVLIKVKPIKQDFQLRCKKLCEQLCFHLQVFQRLYKQNYRKKSVLIKFYGWDKEFEEILFHKHRQDLRNDINPENLYTKFNFGNKSFESRNTYNKVRLFVSEIINNNRRQQQLQSKFMKLRLNSQLGKLDKQILELAKDKKRKDIREYLQQIGRTHDLMLNTKIKIHNKMQSLNKIQQNTGRVRIKEYYGIEEKDIDEVQKYFTRLRLQKRH